MASMIKLTRFMAISYHGRDAPYILTTLILSSKITGRPQRFKAVGSRHLLDDTVILDELHHIIYKTYILAHAPIINTRYRSTINKLYHNNRDFDLFLTIEPTFDTS